MSIKTITKKEKEQILLQNSVNTTFQNHDDKIKQEIINILKKKDNKFLNFPFGLKYYYDIESREYEMFYMPKYRNTITLHKYKETFVLDKPTDYYKGRPIFTVLKGFPISIPMKIEKSLESNLTDVKLYGRSSSDLFAKLHSPYIQRFFALKGLTTLQYISILLSILCSISMTFIITYIFMMSV